MGGRVLPIARILGFLLTLALAGACGSEAVTEADSESDFGPSAVLPPDGVVATTFRPDRLVQLSGELVTVHDRPCLAIRQPDGTEIGLVWSIDFVEYDGIGITGLGEPAHYVEVGETIEVIGDWYDAYADRYAPVDTKPCRADKKIWVTEIMGGDVAVPTDEPVNLAAIQTEAVCSDDPNDVHFPQALLDGPRLTRDEFIATPQGEILEALSGDLELGLEMYRESTGFSIATDSYVLGYLENRPESAYLIGDDAQVQSWRRCHPHLIKEDIVAARWFPTTRVAPDADAFEIEVQGIECGNDEEVHSLTEIVATDVVEEADVITVVAWTRNRPLSNPTFTCDWKAVPVEATVKLAMPKGQRSIVDGGTVPVVAPQPR